MPDSINLNLDYERLIRIAEDINWVGFYDSQTGLHCNPYLIVDGDEAVVIDGGSRPDFAVVMMKILKQVFHPIRLRHSSTSIMIPICAGVSRTSRT